MPKLRSGFFVTTAWVGFLLILWAESRALCVHVGLPSDCHAAGPWEVYTDINSLVEKGVVIAWLSNLQNVDEFYGSTGKIRATCIVSSMLFVGPVFSLVGEIPGLQTSLNSFELRASLPTVVYSLALISCLAGFVYQRVRIKRVYGAATLGTYLTIRLALIVFYASFALLLSRDYLIHLHHLYVGYLLACMAYDDSFVSLIFLVVGAGIMVQGIGAYNYAPIVDAS